MDFTNGKYCAGVVAFVSITVKSFDIHRENIGYATSTANSKGFAIYKSRKVKQREHKIKLNVNAKEYCCLIMARFNSTTHIVFLFAVCSDKRFTRNIAELRG